MKSSYRIWCIILCLAITVFTSACSRQTNPLTQRQFFAFGTLVELSLFGVEQPLAEQAIADVETEFQRMHKHWHAWHPSALTSLNNKFSASKPMILDAELIDLIDDSVRLSSQSNGLFNPAVGQLIRLWGFQQDEFAVNQPPGEAAIRALLQKKPGMDDLVLTNHVAYSHNPAVQLDLGAVAKGYGIDRVIERLQKLGVANAIVNCGGDLRAIGSHGDRPWRIGIRKPRGAGVLASIELENDESIFTSGDYERFFELEGKRYHHILDPRTGYPAQGVTSVTVVHKEAATADAAATALFVAGPEAWHEIAMNMGIRYVMLIDTNGTVHMNPAMAKRVQFEAGTQPNIRISEPL